MPLSPRATGSLLGITRTKQVTAVLDKLHPVVQFNRDNLDEPLTLAPGCSTFPQFLVDPSRCPRSCLVDARQQHARLAKRCLDALSTLGSSPASSNGYANVAEPAGLVGTDISEHVQYAALYWAVHLAEASTAVADVAALVKALVAFTSEEKLLEWLQTLKAMGQLETAATSLSEADQWVAQVRIYSSINLRVLELTACLCVVA